MLARFMESRLQYGVLLEVQADVINGTGASGNLGWIGLKVGEGCNELVGGRFGD